MSDVVWVDDDNNEILRIPADHLPECPKSNNRMIALYGDQCLCPALRVCEQRVEHSVLDMDEYALGHHRALDEAIEIVEASVDEWGLVASPYRIKAAIVGALRELRDESA